MTIKIASIKNNVAVEREGQYIEIPEWPGVSLGVRSTEYGPYKIALDQLVQRLARKYRSKTVDPEERDNEIGRLVAKHILFGWKGFDQEYTADFAEELIGSAEGRDLARHTLWAAGRVGETEIEFVVEAVKNSEPPSVTI